MKDTAFIPFMTAAGYPMQCMDDSMFGQRPAPIEWLIYARKNVHSDLSRDMIAEGIETRWREACEVGWPSKHPDVACACRTSEPDRGAECRECGAYVPVTTGQVIDKRHNRRRRT